MFSSNLLPRSAFGLCLAMAPLMVGIPSAQTSDEDDAVFVPLVDACVSMPTVETCQQVRAVISECASNLDYEGCSVLFVESEEVFEDPAQMERSQIILSEAAEAIATMEFTDVPHKDFVEELRADAERTLLLGDENLMSHSSPPVLEGDAPPVDAESGESDPPPSVGD